MNSKLYVGNLAFETLELELQDLFAQAGTVTEATLMQDRMSGQSRGFGFVTMSTAQEAQDAIKRFHGTQLHGRALTVNEARPREDRAGAPSGGGGNRGPRRQYQRSY